MRTSHDWFWLHFWLDEKSGASILSQSCGVESANQLLFDTQKKTALTLKKKPENSSLLSYKNTRDNNKPYRNKDG